MATDVKEVSNEADRLYRIQTHDKDADRTYYLLTGNDGQIKLQYQGLRKEPYISDFQVPKTSWPIKTDELLPDVVDDNKNLVSFYGKVTKISQLDDRDSGNGCHLFEFLKQE